MLPNPVLDFQQIDEADDNDVSRCFSAFVNRTWDLGRGKTFGTVVLSKENGHSIVFGYHHIIMDASGWAIFLRDLSSAYALRLPRNQVKGYIDYTLKYGLNQQDFQRQIDFWENELKGLSADPLPLLPVSSTRIRSANSIHETHHVHKELGTSDTAALKKICRSLRITPFHFHLAVLQSLLVAYLDVQDVCIGIADANRMDEEFADTMVFKFVSMLTIPLNADMRLYSGLFYEHASCKISRLERDANISDIAQRTSRKLNEVLDNAMPFDLILGRLNISRSSTHTPLFQVAMNYRLGDVWEVSVSTEMT